MTAIGSSLSNSDPASGSSTKTTSPSCSAANFVMPTVALSPSIWSHSWSSVNFSIRGLPLPWVFSAPLSRLDERHLDDGHGQMAAPDLCEKPGADPGIGGGDIAHCDRRFH